MTSNTQPQVGPSAKERKYDRQLRLWAASGQAALEDARILLVNSGCGTVGVEALKNLVLPGIGHFTIYDPSIVTESDLGVNFFLDEESLGHSRAECCTNHLLELNPEVHGDWFPKADSHEAAECSDGSESKRIRTSNSPSDSVIVLQQLLEALPAFTTVLYSLPINPEFQDMIEAYGDKNQIPVFSAHSVGFYAYFNVKFPYTFPIVETHPSTEATSDLRLLAPWKELTEFVDKITENFQEQEHHTHGHVPFVAILLYYLNVWKKDHDGLPPSTYPQKNEFRNMITQAMRTDNPEGGEENFEEAIAAVMRSLTAPSLPSDLKDIFDYLDEKSDTLVSSQWTVAKAIKVFYQRHKCLPLTGSIPDMKAESNVYIELQGIYKRKAKADVDEVHEIAKSLKNGECVSEEEVAIFCKNASFSKLIRVNSEDGVTLQQVAEKEAYNDELAQVTGMPLSLLPIYLCLKATSHVSTSSTSGIISAIHELISPPGDQERLQNIATEVSRAAGSELHNISAAVGGMLAQEMIKVTTRQYIPIDNTCIFDGISSRCQILRL
ncbi:hypothetical protein TD95_003020 [Thielaviopsis punctulata]|uniref:NEDD8-activating enzyme E1 regulatory subunit n=1 Tax=Thielaviopsis punctulata TaxID=72032 RepID=A0A0F4ZDM4_9PEZI|nr:hypothetical protein TD95_003020 [Thielaviopsis punctulata]